MRTSVLVVLGLVLGVAFGWQGEVRAAAGDNQQITIPLGDAAVMDWMGEICNTGRRRGTTGYPLAACDRMQRIPGTRQYGIRISEDYIEIFRGTRDGRGSNDVFYAAQPANVRAVDTMSAIIHPGDVAVLSHIGQACQMRNAGGAPRAICGPNPGKDGQYVVQIGSHYVRIAKEARGCVLGHPCPTTVVFSVTQPVRPKRGS